MPSSDEKCACTCHKSAFDQQTAFYFLTKFASNVMYPYPAEVTVELFGQWTEATSEAMEGNDMLVNAPVSSLIIMRLNHDVVMPGVFEYHHPDRIAAREYTDERTDMVEMATFIHKLQHGLLPYVEQLAEWAQSEPQTSVASSERVKSAGLMLDTIHRQHADCRLEIAAELERDHIDRLLESVLPTIPRSDTDTRDDG